MTKWTFEDDCLVPQGRIKIEYRGKDPFGMTQKVKAMALRIFDVGMVDFWERDFRWDIATDPRAFFIRYYVNKSFDFRSTILTEIVFQGLQPTDPNKDGTLVVFIGAKLKTEYNLKSKIAQMPFYRGLLKIYNLAFYNRVRRQYLVLCNQLVDRFNKEFRANLNLPNT